MSPDDLKALLAKATARPWWDEATTVEVESCIAGSRRQVGLPTTVEEQVVTVESSHVIIADCAPGLGDRGLDEVMANAKAIAAVMNRAELLVELWGWCKTLESSINSQQVSRILAKLEQP